MSQVMKFLDEIYEVHVGVSKTFETIVENQQGEVLPLTDEDLYNYGRAEIVRPDGTMLGVVDVNFTDRDNAVAQWSVKNDITNSANAGNWMVHIKIYNVLDKQIDELRASFNIVE